MSNSEITPEQATAAQEDIAQQGPVEQGPVEQGPVEQAAPQQKPSESAGTPAARSRSTRSTAARSGTARSGTATSAAAKSAAPKSGTTRANAAKAGTAKAGTAKAGTAKAGTSKPPATKSPTAKTDTAKSGTARTGTAKAGTAKAGTAKAGTAKAGTAKAGTAKAGTAASRTTRRAPSSRAAAAAKPAKPAQPAQEDKAAQPDEQIPAPRTAEKASSPTKDSATAASDRAEVMRKAWQDPKLANVVYHDWEAETYDHKWSVDYDERCMEYVSDRFALIAGREGWPYGDALEVGCGTGFFSLNLKGAGVVDHVHVTDLSSKMVETAKRNGAALGFEVEGRVADAERLPYDDDTFDLVIGHAMLHHIPDVELALRECLRVLKPGGRFVFAGEPTVIGDWVARRLGRITWIATTQLTRLPGLRHLGRSEDELQAQAEEAHLEWVVDLHTFDPTKLRRMAVAAGAADAKVATEQLTAAWFGWPVRTIEAAIPRERLGVRWALFAYRTWQRLSIFDEKVASRILPKAVFYNVLVTGTKPVHAGSTQSNEQPQTAGRR